MLAPAKIPEEFLKWNQQWDAPFGTAWTKLIPRVCRYLPGLAKLCGYFAFQTNNDTRVFEYPWVCSTLQSKTGTNILEIGGGVSGFQFMLDHIGYRVINVDPGKAAHGKGWPVTTGTIAALNNQFASHVELKNCFIEDAGIKDESIDHVISISTIEHIPDDDIQSILGHVHRVLKPGGVFIVTLDLFLDIQPFSGQANNRYGKNVSTKWLVEQSGLNLVYGNPAELYGFPEFDGKEVYNNREKYLVGGGYPAMVQMMVLQKSCDEHHATFT